MFDWQTDDVTEEIWQGAKPSPVSRWRWGVILLIVGLLGISYGAVRLSLESRSEQVLTEIEQDIMVSETFLNDVTVRQDEELFVTLLSGRDPVWADTQIQLLRQNAALQSAPRLLGFEPFSTTTTIVSSTVSPDLNQTTVLVEQTYAQVETEELVTLQRLLVFRRGETRWLLSPPPDSFWGSQITSRGPFLSLQYPVRDWDISRRMAQDLERQIRLTCDSLLGSACTEPITVRFETDPAGLLEIASPKFPVVVGDELVLPTPSLVGVPTDDAGYRAMLDGYTTYVLAYLLNKSVSWTCCQNSGGYHSLLTYQLSQPTGSASGEQRVNFDVLDSLDELPVDTRPEQDLALFCQQPEPALHRYSFLNNSWQTERIFRDDTVNVGPLPDDSGYFLAQLIEAEQTAQSVIVRDGEEAIIATSLTELFYFPISPEVRDPAGSRLLTWYVERRGVGTGYAAIDFDNCQPNACSRELLPGLPVWSPSGEFQVNQLLEQLFPLALLPAGETRSAPFDNGLKPFWLDETTFGFFSGSRNQFLEAHVATVDNPTSMPLLTLEELAVSLPAGRSALYLSFYDIIPIPSNPHSAFVLAHDSESAFIFLLEKGDAQASWRDNAATGRLHLSRLATLDNHTFTIGSAPHLTPDEQILALPLIARNETPYKTYLLFNWQSQTSVLLGPTENVAIFVDWSADGQWLARPGDTFIEILAPALGDTPTTYRQILFHDWQACSTTFWLD